MPSDPPPTDFRTVLHILGQHKVDYIIVGGFSAVLQGSPLLTNDLDLVHARTPENLARLEAALIELNAIYREQPSRRLRPTISHLASPGHQLLLTSAGPLDCLGAAGNNLSYEDLLPHSVEWILADGNRVRILGLEMVIQLKEAANRPKDQAQLPILRQLLAERQKTTKPE